ncbi:MAG TPA: aldehyde dehydrogenase [Miltoncostaeaceae bacterium]|nr:aldehyde dehydrogenase [Miltoncostaeaceae bacterium]
MSLDARLACAARSRALLAAAADAVVDAAVAEAGTPRRFARREVDSALGLLDALPALAEAIRPRAVPAASGTTTLEWMPFGVVFGWHAANSPVWVPTLVASSALAGGNTVVCRPSRRCRRTTGVVLAALAAAWPADALVVLDDPDPVRGEALIGHPEVGAVVAHASTATCRRHLARLAEACAAGAPLRPYIPEASGNDAMIVLPGADPARVAEAVALGGYANAGQLCMSAKRLIVDRTAWPDLRGPLAAAIGALVVGDPDDERTDIGPLAEGPARTQARAALAEARAAGGELVVGEGERGGLFTPTLVLLPRPVHAALMLWREEVFAPLRSVVLADGPEDALALANDSVYGLGASVFGGAGAARDRVVAGLRAARVVVDEGPLYQDAHLVVGGVGDSGLAGARPKIEQLVWARRTHRAAGG